MSRERTFFVGFIFFLSCLLFPFPKAWSVTYTFTQLTNNADNTETGFYYDIDNGQVVWSGYHNKGLFLYDSNNPSEGNKPIQLAERCDAYLQIDNGQVVWGTLNAGHFEIFLYNGTLPFIQLTDNGFHPKIDNGQVVWQNFDTQVYDSDFSEIFFYNGSKIIQLTDNQDDESSPWIDNGQIVWQTFVRDIDPPGYKNHIFFYNGSTIVQLTKHGTQPQINNGQVVWLGCGGSIDEQGIFLYDGSRIIQLRNTGTYCPVGNIIDHGQVVWMEYDGHDYEIFLYDGKQIIQLTNNNENDSCPSIKNGKVVWSGYDGQIFLYNGTLPPIQLRNNNYTSGMPVIDDKGNIVFVSCTGYIGSYAKIELFLATPLSDEENIVITPDLSTVMLGEKVTFSSTNNQQPISVSWATTAIDPINSPLFPNNIGVFFDSQTEGSSKIFQAVHLGKGEITVEATINGKQVKITKNITVIKPDKLGTTYNQYDSEIIKTADDTGILPQYIKSHIYKESYKKFNPKSYRYEPGYDFENIQLKKIKLVPYSKYALESGEGVNAVNKTPRNKYSIDTKWVFPQKTHTPDIRKIQDSDTMILCSNIFYNNDKTNAKENWLKKSPRAIRKLKRYWQAKKKDFIAQTIIASSYGLLQMMYDIAVDEGDFGDDDPINLFDPLKNLKVAGEIYVHRFYKWKKPRLPLYYPDNYKDENQWKEEWINLFQKWNSKEAGYGKKVINQAKDFLPLSN